MKQITISELDKILGELKACRSIAKQKKDSDCKAVSDYKTGEYYAFCYSVNLLSDFILSKIESEFE